MVVNLGKTDPPAVRRGSRRRRRRESALVWWALFAAFAVAAWTLRSWHVALLGLLAWCLYQLVLVPTLCRVTVEDACCTERARGRLFACTPEHQRVKNGALRRLVGLGARSRGSIAVADRALILLAVAGTVAAVVGTAYILT
ncbi:hypothetical protein [Actinomadura fibrosa]|uniref:Uncharacterized protein n=1 Tax=Actinomadura fibrosa TaxID=111802 RepID=A0ABW2Y3Q7_9ACTN|nr:hypothetical protein [Actinomadura fibrosa]